MAKGGKQFMLNQLKNALQDDAPEFEEPRRRFVEVPLPDGIDVGPEIDELASQLRPYLRGEKKLSFDGKKVDLFAAFLIPAEILDEVKRPGEIALPSAVKGERKGIQYWSTNLADDDLQDAVENVLNEDIRRREYVARQIDAEVVQQVQRTKVPFSKLNPKKEVGKEEVSMADVIRQWAPVAFVYLLWIAIFTISNMLLNNTIEEKSNRIIEVLLSSVTPRELMLGKLFGIAAIGLTMLAAWIGSAVVILSMQSGAQSEITSQLLNVLTSSGLLPAFAVYFLLGYFMYAGAFMAVGSVCNTIKEAQNLMGVVTIVMIVPLLTMTFIPKDPNGTLATIMSWIPIYTPFVMMNRAAADPPLFDLIGTTILLVIFTGLSLWSTGKIFRIGVLRTGQPPKLLEMVRWLKRS
jgi:ABC-2 type transport system permease protein